MGTSSKKHHYVPQAMLRNFSSDTARTRIHVFDKARIASFDSTIVDAGCENHFNTVQIDGERVNFEFMFNNVDDIAAKLIGGIIQSEQLSHLTMEDHINLAIIVASQIVRTKMARTTLLHLHDQIGDFLEDLGFDSDKVEGFSRPTEEDMKRGTIDALKHLHMFVEQLMTKRLVLIAGEQSAPFWTSDNPVVKHNTFPYGGYGLDAKGIEIYMPISAKLVVGFWCPTIETKIERLLAFHGPDAVEPLYSLHERLQNGQAVPVDVDRCKFFNFLQVRYSSRFLYGPNDDFSLAQEILAAEPELQNLQSTMVVGRPGKGAVKKPRMPDGEWVVFYGNTDHFMLKADKWDENSRFLEFETRDVGKLDLVLNDQPIEQAILFQNGVERKGMRNVRVEVEGNQAPVRVRVSFRDEGLNRILRSTADRRSPDKSE